MQVAVTFAMPGLLLVLWGFVAWRRSSRARATLPPARMEGGRVVLPSVDPTQLPPRAGGIRIALGVLLAVGGGFFGYLADQFAGFYRFGRPLRVQGRPRRCRRARGTGWHDDARPRLEPMGAWSRAVLGERWLAAARAEHASVPAFRRLASQLVAAGAPGSLVDRCEAAAADEIRHARRCFALARAYSGIDWTAGALPHAPDAAFDLAGGPAVDPASLAAGSLVDGHSAVDLASLAAESLVDGCLGERVAADLARAGAVRATDPVIRETLVMIANDEAAHAELAWAVVMFCVERGDAKVHRAVAAAARTARGRASRGPIDLGHAACTQIARARLASVRARLATLMPADSPVD